MVGPNRLVAWSPEALTDLAEIWSYYANAAGPSTADDVIRGIETACRLLEDHPFAGRAREELRPGLRSIAVRAHVVFSRVAPDASEVVRVLHGRRDINRIFADETTN